MAIYDVSPEHACFISMLGVSTATAKFPIPVLADSGAISHYNKGKAKVTGLLGADVQH